MALTREQVELYLKGQGHPQPDVDGTLDEFMYGDDRQAMYDEAVLNNYALPDVNRWFHLVKVMGIDLPFDTAIKIDSVLHEADLETMELNLPEERFGLDPYGRGVFRGAFDEVKKQIREQVIQKDGFTVGQLAGLQVPGLKLSDAFQLYAQLRGETDGAKTLFLMDTDRMYDLSCEKDGLLRPYDLDKIVEPFLMKESLLDQFIEQEVPFRLAHVLGVGVSDKECSDLVEVVKDNSDVMFDYERFDSYLMDKYEEVVGLESDRIQSIRVEICNLRKELDGAIAYDPDLVPSIDKRLCSLQNELDGLLRAKPRIFIFDDELTLNDDNVTLSGYVWAVDALVDRLPSSEDMENINFYPEYNLVTGEVTLTATYDTPTADGECNKALEVSLTDDEKKLLISMMENYCKLRWDVSCMDFVNEFREREGLPHLSRYIRRESLVNQISAAEAKTTDRAPTREDLATCVKFDRCI